VRRIFPPGVLRLGLGAALLTAICSAQPAVAEAPTPVAVSASPIERFDARTPIGASYGSLVFRGGLALSSRDPEFGGLSGLRLSADGARFTAVSDKGRWFTGALRYEGDRLAGVDAVSGVALTPPAGGKALRWRKFDTESLEIEGRSAWVGVEGLNEVARYALDADGLPGAGRRVPLPREAARAPGNAGFEAIATRSDGALVIVAERFLDAEGDNRAFVVGSKTPFAFSVRRSNDFSPTDLARLPDGDFVLLERRFIRPFSLSVRMRLLAAKDIRAGAVVEGPVLMEASLAQAIDNLEAVSVHRAADGAIVITTVSDDNYSVLQRTLMLQFELRR
jgi:hypothetical protein